MELMLLRRTGIVYLVVALLFLAAVLTLFGILGYEGKCRSLNSLFTLCLFVVSVEGRFVRPAKGTTVEPTKDTVDDDDIRADSRKCYGFPEGLTVETDVVIGWSSRWKNQCHEGTIAVGLWSPSENRTVEDMKCCQASVDHVLSESIFGLYRKHGGSNDLNHTWNVQCSDNYVMTGLKIVGNKEIAQADKQIAGVKCSALINKKIDYNKCQRIEHGTRLSSSRDPAFKWAMECPTGMALVALYDQRGFKSLKYGKCCSIENVRSITTLPMSCPVTPTGMCGWSLSKNSSLSWQYMKNGNLLQLNTGPQSGSAKLTSPGYAAPQDQLCFRLTYRLFLVAALKIRMKSYNNEDKVAVVKELGVLTQMVHQLTSKDFIVKTSSNFQIIVEGIRLKYPVSNVFISKVGFVGLDDCKADRCSPPNKGCADNELCLPAGGYNKCHCKRGYLRQNGICVKEIHRVTTTLSSVTKTGTSEGRTGDRTLPTSGGQGRGGDGKGVKTIFQPTHGPNKKKSQLASTGVASRFDPWIYTVIGAICGTLLVLFLVFSFLTYRNQRVSRRRHQFDLEVSYLRTRSFSGSVMSENNNSYVPEPTFQMSRTELSDPVCIEMRPYPVLEVRGDDASIHTGTPPSHHYFEVEPETDLERKVSEMTLVSPFYGSSEDVSDQSDEKGVFLEPPSDEKELCAQLNREIDWRELNVLHDKQLGQGAFGYVHLGVWRTADGSNKTVAIKSMKDSDSAEERIKFLQEAAIMKQFAHQNVVFMFGVVTKRYPPMIVLEYMKNGNLRKYLRKEKKMRIKHSLQRTDRDLHRRLLKMAREVAAGMTYLSGMQFVHRKIDQTPWSNFIEMFQTPFPEDLAARNILLDENMVCKIGDFGLARDLIGCEHYISKGGQIPVKWTAPEALNFRRYSSASDVWSFGVLLYEIWAVGNKPYDGWTNDEVIENVCNKGYRMPPPKDCPRVLYHLMIDCWHPEESKRPRFSQIKFCLAQKDDRLLGRERDSRPRSVTLNDIPCDTIKEEDYGELQYVYCKTD